MKANIPLNSITNLIPDCLENTGTLYLRKKSQWITKHGILSAKVKWTQIYVDEVVEGILVNYQAEFWILCTLKTFQSTVKHP